MRRVLRVCAETGALRFDKVLLEFEKICEVTLADNTLVITALTKLQRTILETLGVPLKTLTTQPT